MYKKIKMSKYRNVEYPDAPELNKKLIGGILLLVVLIVLVWKSSVTIGAGYAGVLFRTFGDGVETNKTYSEGFHFIAPWNKMVKIEVRQQQVMEQMAVLSSNGLEISIDLSVWHQPVFAKLPLLYKEKGIEYVERVVKPAIRSATRSVIGRYTPEEIYSSKREVIQEEINIETRKVLERQYVQLNEVLVRDIMLPPTIKTAIENKLKQEQESLEYEFRLEKAQKEAKRQLIDAEGKAKANQILSASLTDKILQEKGIEATLELAKSPNSKVVVVGGGKDGLPLILGNN